jgi:hypothetical protein
MSALGTEGELRSLGSSGRNRRDFCRGNRVGSTRSIDPQLTFAAGGRGNAACLGDAGDEIQTRCPAGGNHKESTDETAEMLHCSRRGLCWIVVRASPATHEDPHYRHLPAQGAWV